MKFLTLILIVMFIPNSTDIHQDRILKIDDNGNIIGLPEEYGPAKFDIEKKYLKIKDKEITFPNCINYYFNIHDNPKLGLSASWYHSKEIMPYYLNFEISQKNEDYGYTLLIDLETLEIIYLDVSIEKGDTTYNHRIKIDDRCSKDYNDRIKCLTE